MGNTFRRLKVRTEGWTRCVHTLRFASLAHVMQAQEGDTVVLNHQENSISIEEFVLTIVTCRFAEIAGLFHQTDWIRIVNSR